MVLSQQGDPQFTQDTALYDVCTPVARPLDFCDGTIAALDECLATNHPISMAQHDDTSIRIRVEAERA